MKRKLVALALGLGLTYAAQGQTASQRTADEIDAADYDAFISKLISSDMTVIEFEKGSDKLSSAAKDKLAALAKATRNDKNIDALVVAAWADVDYPAAKGEQVSDAERKLADNRKNEVERVLEKANADDVSSYSMAEQPGWIAKTFNTEGALIKNKGKKLTDQSRLEAAIGKRIRGAGGPGKAVVVVRYDTDVVAH